MTTSPEDIFRQVETKLNQLLTASKEALKQQGFLLTDLSARNYHYKNPYLSWSLKLSKDLKQNSLIERTTVTLTFMEPVQAQLPPATESSADNEKEIQIVAQLEKFYPGQPSMFDKKIEDAVSIQHLKSNGLLAVILELTQKLNHEN